VRSERPTLRRRPRIRPSRPSAPTPAHTQRADQGAACGILLTRRRGHSHHHPHLQGCPTHYNGPGNCPIPAEPAHYLDFPHVGQVFAIERQTTHKRTGKVSTETVYGITDHSPDSAQPERILAFNRDHWRIEAHHYMLDWTWDEDRCRLSAGHGPQNITRLRRFAIGLIKSKSNDSVAATTQKLARNLRRVFDYLGMTKNSQPRGRSTVPAG
jgi:hypothetical protein